MSGPLFYDVVGESFTTTGTGTLTLAGARTGGLQSFAVVGDGNKCYYRAYDPAGSDYEVGIGTYTASGTTLSRDVILASSNSGSAVSWASGTKNIDLVLPAYVISPVVQESLIGAYSLGGV